MKSGFCCGVPDGCLGRGRSGVGACQALTREMVAGNTRQAWSWLQKVVSGGRQCPGLMALPRRRRTGGCRVHISELNMARVAYCRIVD